MHSKLEAEAVHAEVKLNYVSMKLLSLGEIFTFDFKFNFHSRFALQINFAFRIFNRRYVYLLKKFGYVKSSKLKVTKILN